MTFQRSGEPTGTPSLIRSFVFLGYEFENIPTSARTPEEVRHVRLGGEISQRVRGLEFLRSDTPEGAAFDLVSTCCQTPVSALPTDGNEMMRCATCGLEHGLARHVEALGAWLVCEANREKRPLDRATRRRAERELASLHR